MNNELPLISIVIPTYNSQISLPDCLRSIASQRYPKEKLEIIVVDGSSSDDTQKIASSHNVTLIKIPRAKQNAEHNKSVGFRRSKGAYVLMLDSDNILPHDKWLRNMISPFLKHKKLVGVDTLYFTYHPNNSFLDRYLALFGSLDPVAYYLNKVDKLPYGKKEYTLLGKSEEYKNYFLVTFKKNALPSIGSNGFMVKKDIFSKFARIDAKHFFHTDIHVDVISKGFNTYAFVKESIIHKTGNRNIINFLIRRYTFLIYNLTHQEYRRHSVYQDEDMPKLILYIVFSATLVKPLYDAILGYRRIPDAAWFLHPLFCFLFLVIYTGAFLYVAIRKYLQKFRYI